MPSNIQHQKHPSYLMSGYLPALGSREGTHSAFGKSYPCCPIFLNFPFVFWKYWAICPTKSSIFCICLLPSHIFDMSFYPICLHKSVTVSRGLNSARFLSLGSISYCIISAGQSDYLSSYAPKLDWIVYTVFGPDFVETDFFWREGNQNCKCKIRF